MWSLAWPLMLLALPLPFLVRALMPPVVSAQGEGFAPEALQQGVRRKPAFAAEPKRASAEIVHGKPREPICQRGLVEQRHVGARVALQGIERL